MIKAYKYRIYPNNEQQTLINKHIGACRFLYNLALETKMSAYSVYQKNLSRYDLQVQLKELKKECEWLKEINSQSLQTSLMNLDAAYLKFFKGVADFPSFKKKHQGQSFQCPQSVSIEDNKLWLPKFKTGINIKQHRLFTGLIRTVTISKTPTNKYFASILVEDEKALPTKKIIKETTSVGIDVGIKTFAVLSDGTECANPKHLRNAISRIKILQNRASKKKKGSANRKKANLRIAIQHEKITNKRKDFLHKVSDAITKQFDTVIVEDLNISGMIKNHKLAQSISDVGWGNFALYTKYKSEWRGKNYLTIGRFEPSSKLHNSCGYLNKNLQLSDREWLCPNCGETVLRDLNAAINIKNFGLIKSGAVRSKELVELPTLVGTLKQEAPSPLGKG